MGKFYARPGDDTKTDRTVDKVNLILQAFSSL